MALVQLSDAYIPEVYESYTQVDGPELTAFLQSGIAVRDAGISAAFANGGEINDIPFWKDLDSSIEPNYGTDNPADIAVPNKITSGLMINRIASLNQTYSAADLVSELSGSNPMQRIRNRFSSYWSKQWQKRLIAAINGVLLDNVANDSSDMVNDISIADGANAQASNLFSRSAMTGAIFTSGDHFDEYAAIAVHSIVLKRMMDNDEIETVYPSQPDPNLPLNKQAQRYFLGKRVIVDDSMPVVAGGVSGYVYTSVLFGEGVIGFGERTPVGPSFITREELQGNGAGVEIIGERKSWCIHPFGFAFTSAAIAPGTHGPSLAELANVANWDRRIERKNVPLAFLKTNG